jgi:amino acid efflux transporter
VAVAANLCGLGISARVQVALSAAVALVLLAAAIAAVPRVNIQALTPFMPGGWGSVGRATVLLFFAFFGWEAITHLSAEFRDPARDVPRSTVLAAALVTAIYVGVSFAVVATGTYGTKQLDRVAVARLLGNSLGVSAKSVASAAAVLITVGTANTFVAATSRLAYALARDSALPAPLGRLSKRAVPDVAIVLVGAVAAAALVLGYFERWGADAFLVVPNSLVIVVYVAAMAAGVRLLTGSARAVAVAAAALCLIILPFAGVALAIPVGVAAAALLYTTWRRRRERGGKVAIGVAEIRRRVPRP